MKLCSEAKVRNGALFLFGAAAHLGVFFNTAKQFCGIVIYMFWQMSGKV